MKITDIIGNGNGAQKMAGLSDTVIGANAQFSGNVTFTKNTQSIWNCKRKQ